MLYSFNINVKVYWVMSSHLSTFFLISGKSSALQQVTRVSVQYCAVAVGVRPDGGVPVLPLTGHRPGDVIPRPLPPHQAGVDKRANTLNIEEETTTTATPIIVS